MLSASNAQFPAARAGHARYVELAPTIVKLLLLLFMIDLVIRRWENIRGLAEWVGEKLPARGRSAG